MADNVEEARLLTNGYTETSPTDEAYSLTNATTQSLEPESDRVIPSTSRCGEKRERESDNTRQSQVKRRLRPSEDSETEDEEEERIPDYDARCAELWIDGEMSACEIYQSSEMFNQSQYLLNELIRMTSTPQSYPQEANHVPQRANPANTSTQRVNPLPQRANPANTSTQRVNPLPQRANPANTSTRRVHTVSQRANPFTQRANSANLVSQRVNTANTSTQRAIPVSQRANASAQRSNPFTQRANSVPHRANSVPQRANTVPQRVSQATAQPHNIQTESMFQQRGFQVNLISGVLRLQRNISGWSDELRQIRNDQRTLVDMFTTMSNQITVLQRRVSDMHQMLCG